MTFFSVCASINIYLCKKSSVFACLSPVHPTQVNVQKYSVLTIKTAIFIQYVNRALLVVELHISHECIIQSNTEN